MQSRSTAPSMQAIIDEARAAAERIQQSQFPSWEREDMAIAAIWCNDERIWSYSGPESFAEARAKAFTEVLKRYGLPARWTSRVD